MEAQIEQRLNITIKAKNKTAINKAIKALSIVNVEHEQDGYSYIVTKCVSSNCNVKP